MHSLQGEATVHLHRVQLTARQRQRPAHESCNVVSLIKTGQLFLIKRRTNNVQSRLAVDKVYALILKTLWWILALHWVVMYSEVLTNRKPCTMTSAETYQLKSSRFIQTPLDFFCECVWVLPFSKSSFFLGEKMKSISEICEKVHLVRGGGGDQLSRGMTIPRNRADAGMSN